MARQIAKITSKGQMTISKAARDAVRLAEGDWVVFEVEGDHLVARKLPGDRDPYLLGVEASLREWNSPEDEAASRDFCKHRCPVR